MTQTYAAAGEILAHPEMNPPRYLSDLKWVVDSRRKPAEMTAFSHIPSISYGISLRTDAAREPWQVRVLHPGGSDKLAFVSLASAVEYVDGREGTFLDMYGAA